jgi:hypothetical protein
VIYGWQEAYLGDSELLSVGVPPSLHPCPSLGECTREEATWAALKERPTSKVPTQEEMTKVLDQQGLVPTEGGATPVGCRPTRVEATVVDVLPIIDDIHVNEVEPRLEDVFGGYASAPGPLRGPGSRPPGDATSGDAISAPRSSDIVDSGAIKLRLPGYSRAPLPPTSWRWGCKADVFVGCSHGLTTAGDVVHGQPRCPATSPGKS